MIRSLRFLALVVCTALYVLPLSAAEEEPEIIVRPLSGEGQIFGNFTEGIVSATNGVAVLYGNAYLTADSVEVNHLTGDVDATGKVHIHRDDQTWAGDHIRYNFKTRVIEAELFRTGKYPVFAEGEKLRADQSNQVYTAKGAFVTTDDISEPFSKVRAKSITIVPGKKITLHHATFYMGGVPVFYFPYYVYDLTDDNHLYVTPGYRSKFGPYLLGTYQWRYNEKINGEYHLDYRTERGVGTGPDLNLHLGRWGELALKYYYLYDMDPSTNTMGFPNPDNRQRLQLSYDAWPVTNFNVKSQVRYLSDDRILPDFFESDYRRNPQPTTFVEVNKLWDNYSLDVYTQPRLNDFFETVESLPDIKLSSFRQQIGPTPFFYESESSAGYYRRLFAETNNMPTGTDFEAARADTFHQIVMPQTFFGWLTLTPRAGGRFTYYEHASGAGATTEEEYRGVFNTGAELTFKLSRLWTDANNSLLDVHGLRHIIQPSVNYVYVPRPSVPQEELPKFSYQSPSLRLLPIEYPDYNSIDSIDSQNVMRFGVMNKLQTKRDGQLEDLLRWDVYTDWRLRPGTNQTTFADLWSDLLFRPRNWLTLESQTRYDIDNGTCDMSFTTLTLKPNNVWNWTIGHWYLRDDFDSPYPLGMGNNLVTSSIFYRLNEDWAFRATHYYEVRLGRLQEQLYTAYHDFRSWTGALTFRVRNNGDGQDDYTVAFTFSLKAMPRFKVGEDTLRPYQLIGN